MPKPNATFVRSDAPDTGVPAPDAGSDTRAKLDFIMLGAGEYILACPGSGLPLVDSGRTEGPDVKLVMSMVGVLFFADSFFFFFVFSVLPFDKVGRSRNSAACGTALRKK